MRVTILGSGGGLGIPNPFCNCVSCESARADGGKSLRNAPAVLVNDDLLIDCGPDVINCVKMQKRTLNGLRTLAITHRHSDHLDPWFFWARRGVVNTDLPLLTVYSPPDVMGYVLDFYENVIGWSSDQFQEHTRTIWRPVQAGQMKIVGRYRLSFFPATHGSENLKALLVGVRDARAAYLHCYDTGPLDEAAWTHLAQHAFDLVAIDACIGLQQDYENPDHMTAAQVVETIQRMRDTRILKQGGAALATHFVHQDVGRHDELVAHYEPQGIMVAYDGLTLTPGED